MRSANAFISPEQLSDTSLSVTITDAVAHDNIETPWLAKERFVAEGAAAVAACGGVVLGIRLCFHNHAPEQLATFLAFHQQATNQLRSHNLCGAAENGVGEALGERGGYGSGGKGVALGGNTNAILLPTPQLTSQPRKCGSLHQIELSLPSCAVVQHSIRLSLSLTGTAALALASLPLAISPAGAEEAKVTQGTAADLGVMEISLKDAVQFNWGFQGQTQGAGTPNELGIGGFLPLSVGTNSVLFLDVLANVNFSDIGHYSSIINTDVAGATEAGTTISTSSRLGYRWLNGERSWMFGINAGYDSRPLTSGGDDTGVPINTPRTAFFQQVAAGVEAVSNSWNFNAYALVPIGDTEQQLNSAYNGGALDTYGLDAGYSITPDFKASVGYYYQNGDLGEADGSGVRGRLAYNLSNGLTVGANLSYDQAFETRFSADLKYRFGSNGYGAPSAKKAWQTPTIQALTETVRNRDVRVHDATRSGIVTEPIVTRTTNGGRCSMWAPPYC